MHHIGIEIPLSLVLYTEPFFCWTSKLEAHVDYTYKAASIGQFLTCNYINFYQLQSARKICQNVLILVQIVFLDVLPKQISRKNKH